VVEDSVPGVEAAIAAQIRVVGFAVADTVRMIIPIG
jgi:beta-phosphoglucomutase-like phosphatase (HAD superfamily)